MSGLDWVRLGVLAAIILGAVIVIAGLLRYWLSRTANTRAKPVRETGGDEVDPAGPDRENARDGSDEAGTSAADVSWVKHESPASARISLFEPMATKRPSVTAKASARGMSGFTVRTSALITTRSGYSSCWLGGVQAASTVRVTMYMRRMVFILWFFLDLRAIE